MNNKKFYHKLMDLLAVVDEQSPVFEHLVEAADIAWWDKKGTFFCQHPSQAIPLKDKSNGFELKELLTIFISDEGNVQFKKNNWRKISEMYSSSIVLEVENGEIKILKNRLSNDLKIKNLEPEENSSSKIRVYILDEGISFRKSFVPGNLELILSKIVLEIENGEIRIVKNVPGVNSNLKEPFKAKEMVLKQEFNGLEQARDYAKTRVVVPRRPST